MNRGKLFPAALIGACALLVVAGASTAAAAVPKAKAKVSTVNRSFVLPPQTVGFGLGQSNPPCPSNRTLIGGGSRFTNQPLTASIDLVSSGPTADAWETVYDNNLASNQNVLSDAICIRNKLNVKGGDGGQVRPRVKQVTLPLALPPQTTNLGVAETDVACPRRHTVVSGGARVIPGTPGTTSNEIDLFSSAPNPDANSWTVRYDNDSAVGANAEASVLCIKNKSKVRKGEDGNARARVVHEVLTLTLPPQATNAGVAQIDVACPDNTRVVGGGGRHLPGSPINTAIQLFESGPNGNSWHVRYDNDTALAQTVLVSASCLRRNLKVK